MQEIVGLIPGSVSVPWKRKWQPTLMHSPGKVGLLVGCSSWVGKEPDTAKATEHTCAHEGIFTLWDLATGEFRFLIENEAPVKVICWY